MHARKHLFVVHIIWVARFDSASGCIGIFVCMCVSMYVYGLVYVSIFVCVRMMYVCLCLCVQVYTYVCIIACVHAYGHVYACVIAPFEALAVFINQQRLQVGYQKCEKRTGFSRNLCPCLP